MLSILENEDNINYKDVDQYSIWAARHWTFPLLRPLRDDGNCKLSDTMPCSFAQIVDFIFLIIFAIEMVIKMLASGLALHKNAYLRSGWNWLDFIVVFVGVLDQFSSDLPGITTIRLVKTFRPLRSMQRIRGLRVLVQCILEALPQMLHVAVFLIFTLVLFGLFGRAFFAGKLRHACWACDAIDPFTGACLDPIETGNMCDPECTWDPMTVRLDGDRCNSLGNLTKQKESQEHMWRWSYSCRPGEQCLCAGSAEASPSCSYLDNPNYGITSFDSLLWAMLSLFQAISLEGWVDMMYQLMDGCSMFVFVFFIALVLFGAIIVMNLFLAVLCDNFEMADKDGEPEEKEEDVEKEVAKAMAALQHDSPCRQRCLDLVKLKEFDYFIQGCILFNTLLMCLKWAPQPSSYVSFSIHEEALWDYLPEAYWFFLTSMNVILTTIFTAEMFIKLLGLGWNLYKKDFMNLFDAFVVVFSIIEIGLDLNSKANPGTETVPLPLSVLRAFRIFRLFKLVRSVETLRKILATLVSSLKSVVYLALLLCLVILIFILLGIELFGGRYPHVEYNYTEAHFPRTWEKKMINVESFPDGPNDLSRYNFDDFGTALLSIFVVLSGENWNEIMFDSHTATWSNDVSDVPYIPWAILYFIILFVVGNLLLFNLFIAILLSNFEDEDDEEGDDDAEALEEAIDDEKRDEKSAQAHLDAPDQKKPMMEYKFGDYRANTGEGRKSASGPNGAESGEGDEEEVEVKEGFPASVAEGGGDKSLRIFGWDHPLRLFCSKVVLHEWFEPTVLVLILLSTLSLILDRPDRDMFTPLRATISVFNVIFTVLFTIEMLLKIVACGFIVSKTPDKYTLHEAYLRSGWNILDFLIVIISIVSITATDLEGINQLRAFRAIRPMRLVSRYPSLKITFQTLLKSIPAMGSLATVATLFFFIFGIHGLELFGGKFGFCYDPLYGDGEFEGRITPGLGYGPFPQQSNTDYGECMSLPRYNLTRRTTDGILLMDMADMEPNADPDWLNFVEFPQWTYPQFGNFDNIGFSLILLFEVSALEGWPDVMHWAMDTDSAELYVHPWRIDTNPISWMDSDVVVQGQTLEFVPQHIHVTSNIEAGVFFVLWIIFGCFVIVNLTIGIVVDTFANIKAENDGLLLMTDDEADWVMAQKQVLAQRPLKAASQPPQLWRHNFYYLVTSTRFEIFIMVIIMANMLAMACDWFEPNPDAQEYMPDLKTAMQAIDNVFFFIYVIEMCLKWIGLGVDQYFRDAWCVFDFVLVLISAIDFILSLGDGDMPFPAAVVRCLRLFRVARILRIVKTAKQLRTIMLTVYISLPQLNNILILIGLIIVIVDMLLVGFFYAVNYTPGNFDFQDHLNWTLTQSYRNGERYFESDWHYDSENGGYGTNWGDSINRHANFGFFWTGALTLVRSSTGESFNNVMHDLYSWWWGTNRLTCCFQCGPIINSSQVLDQEWVTIPSTGQTVWRQVPQGSCGETAIAFIIYFVFQVVMAYIVLSIMIGIILENFANVGSETKKIRMEDLEDFREVWLKYDPKGTFVVPSHNLLAILQQLREPLGIQGKNPPLTRADMLKHLGQLDIPDHNGYIHFMETLTAVSNMHAGVPLPVCETTNKMAKQALKAPGLKQLERPAHSALTNYLVSLLQSRWRGYAMRKQYTDEAPEGGGGSASGAGYDGKIKPSQVAPQPPS